MKQSGVTNGVRECAPHVVAAFALAYLWNAWAIGFAFALALAASLMRLRERTPTFIGQFITFLGGGAAAYALARPLDGRIQVELGALFAGGAVARLTIARPIFSRGLDVALLTFTFVAIGASREPPKSVYFAACILFALASVLFLSDAPHAKVIRKRGLSALLGVGAAAAVASLLSWGTPRLSGLAGSGFFHAYLSQTGFSGNVRLGDAGPLQTSDEVVMRIRGGKTDYLRGAVLDTFEGNAWSSERKGPKRFANAEAGPLRVAMVKPTTFLFAPHGGIAIADGAMLDAFGATSVSVGISDFSIDPSAGAFDEAPTPTDLSLNRDSRAEGVLRRKLGTLARSIVGSETDPATQLTLLSNYLTKNYRYTLTRRKNPKQYFEILDFLFDSREGHCEFFASAMALLSRAIGIPTRVVTGFRVRETNKYGDYQIVREKHAHAWVEAWVEKKAGWVTVDATPQIEAMESSDSSDASALFDAARERIAAVTAKLATHPRWLLAGLFVLTAAFFGRNFFGLRRRRARARVNDARPYFLALSKELADAGLLRQPWEGVETFALRVEEAGERDAAKLLRRYAAHRYGGTEDDDVLASAFVRLPKIRTGKTRFAPKRTAA